MLETILKKSKLLIAGTSIIISGCGDYSLTTFTTESDANVDVSYGNCSKKVKYFRDSDGDTFGDPNEFKLSCEKPEDHVTNDDDCDDTRYKVNPKAKEICDGLDNDCDNEIDEGLLESCTTVCGEGIKGCVDGKIVSCTAPLPSEEICDGLDNDCDGTADNGFKHTKYCKDKDKDTFGDPKDFKFACLQLSDYVNNCDDCNDIDAKVNPKAPEICDGIDNDCDGIADKKYDIKKCVSYDFVFLIDNSGSMEGKPKTMAYNSLKNLVNGSWQKDDRGIMIPFGSYYEVIGSLTSDTYQLIKNIKDAEKFKGGGTMIGQAFVAGTNQFQNNFQKKRAIIMLTDGETSSSDPYSANSLNQLAKDNNIQVCALGLGSASKIYLSAVSHQIGGYIHINNEKDIQDIFQKNYLALKCHSFETCDSKGIWKKNISPCGLN